VRPHADCVCVDAQARYDVFTSKDVGVDTTEGRFGDVSVLTCRTCGRLWLRYFVEYESQTASGRWFRGLITPDMKSKLSAGNAAEILGELPWLFYGGSFYRTRGARMEGGLSKASLHP
jgi:hypothetical protein